MDVPNGPAAAGPLLMPAADTLLLQVGHPDAEACRAELARFAELETSPDHVHTYKLTDLGLWNAGAAGLGPGQVVASLRRYCAGPVPHAAVRSVVDTMARFGRVVLEEGRPGSGAEILVLRVDDVDDEGPTGEEQPSPPDLLDELLAEESVLRHVERRLDDRSVVVHRLGRGRLKQALLELRWPVDDRAALSPGLPCPIGLNDDLHLRPYQEQAVDSWLPSGTGVIVLPCGAGKTVAAIAAAAAVGARTLILVTGDASLLQWQRELARFTDLDPDQIGVYSARSKDIRPVTLATYHVVATRRDGRFRHLAMVQEGDWGLVIYDEVHLLPSALFQLTASIQSRRRLGLTATLVREDGRQRDVFGLIGPKRFDVPWRELELQGWLAPATCTEVRVPPTAAERLAHARAAAKDKPRLAATVEAKTEVVARLLARHPNESALVIGTYLDGLEPVAERLGAPVVTGSTPRAERLELFDRLRTGGLALLVVSKVANFSIDLPEVAVAVQVSGTFGSRQEEAQRLGRILRPKHDRRQAHFYTVVARDTVEQDHAQRRQRFLAEQGYAYEIIDAESLASLPSGA
jgi:DNA excision repair protein ERCC-3